MTIYRVVNTDEKDGGGINVWLTREDIARLLLGEKKLVSPCPGIYIHLRLKLVKHN